MLQHMDRKETLEYEDESEVYDRLKRLLAGAGQRWRSAQPI